MTAKRIVVVEWYQGGHHQTFFAHLVLALEELGGDVLAICPDPDEIRALIAQLRRLYNVSPSCDSEVIYRKMMVPHKRFSGIRPNRIGAIDWTLRHFHFVEKMAKRWQNESGKRVDLIFYACIYDGDFEWFQTVQPFLSLPWSGLYLQAQSLRMPGRRDPVTGRLIHPEKIFRVPLCKGVAILDEARVSPFAAITQKPVVVFPDLTDERLPTNPNGGSLAYRLKRFADGRPVIGSFGYLRKSKGVLSLASLARQPTMFNACFAFGGDVRWSSFSAEETKSFVEILTNCSNTWAHLLRIPDEEQLNSLLSVCDIIYAAYLDFPHSSNIMTKAALFKKPLIVSDGYLMAERVREFRLGEVVPKGNIDALANAITKITSDPNGWVQKNQPRWSDYYREHSYARLKEAFRELLSKF